MARKPKTHIIDHLTCGVAFTKCGRQLDHMHAGNATTHPDKATCLACLRGHVTWETEDQSKNGVKVLVHKQFIGGYYQGTSVEADCECFGSPFRVHSRMNCPRDEHLANLA